jgi:uncharacterized membrane protein
MPSDPSTPAQPPDHLRFHAPHLHLNSVFGGDWFGRRAEIFARFFGTPTFIIVQTVMVAIWMGANIWGLAHFDLYPFILLNLAFSTQAATRRRSSSSPRPGRRTATRRCPKPMPSTAKP